MHATPLHETRDTIIQARDTIIQARDTITQARDTITRDLATSKSALSHLELHYHRQLQHYHQKSSITITTRCTIILHLQHYQRNSPQHPSTSGRAMATEKHGAQRGANLLAATRRTEETQAAKSMKRWRATAFHTLTSKEAAIY